MKRTRTIIADDGDTKVSVVVKIDSAPGGLMRGEVDRMGKVITDGIMSTLSTTRNLSVYLSDIRVK